MADNRRGTDQPKALTRFLARRDVPCPGCGYNLRGLTGDCCPECSQTVSLGIQTRGEVDPKWLAAVLPLWIVGVPLFLVCALVWLLTGPEMVANYGRSYRNDSTLVTIAVMTLIALVLLVAAVLLTCAAGRRWFHRHDNPNQVLLVIVTGTLAVPVAAMILLGLL